jgi:cytoskeleton protein RodZ
MKPEKEFFSFGRYLQSIRLEKKISLEKVSQETRIAVRNLQLIEKEDLETLPAEVFVRGFLRAFAHAVGADAGEAVRLYDARLKLKSKLSGEGRFSERSSIRLWRHMVLAVLALLSVVVLSIYGFSYFQNQMRLSETSAIHAFSDKSEKALIQDAQGSNAPKDSPTNQFEKLILTIVAVEDLWVKVIIDNKAPNEYNLSSGEHLELEASMGYNLLIGNAGGCELKLNGKPLSISGKIGEVVSLQLP